MYNQLLSIGSVVLLKGEGKKVMVIGYYGVNSQGTNVDYMGVTYPEGYISSTDIVGFNQNEVIQVLHEGYKDVEQERFFTELNAYQNGANVQSSPTVPFVNQTVPVQNTQAVQQSTPVEMPTPVQNLNPQNNTNVTKQDYDTFQ